MFAVELRRRFAELPITEAHPGLFLKARRLSFDQLNRQYVIHADPEISTHERDAVIAALAAREGFSGRWARDLSRDRLPSEQDPSAYWLAPMHYWWFE